VEEPMRAHHHHHERLVYRIKKRKKEKKTCSTKMEKSILNTQYDD
jgi:hypothetical protein